MGDWFDNFLDVFAVLLIPASIVGFIILFVSVIGAIWKYIGWI